MSRYGFLAVSLVLFCIGIFVIFNSIPWGSEAANGYLRSQGGGMDTTQFMIILQEYINAYRVVGGILAITGGLGCIRGIKLSDAQ